MSGKEENLKLIDKKCDCFQSGLNGETIPSPMITSDIAQSVQQESFQKVEVGE